MAKIDIEFSKILTDVLTQGIEYNNDSFENLKVEMVAPKTI